MQLMKNFQNAYDLSNYKKKLVSSVDILFSILVPLSVLLRLICGIIFSDSNNLRFNYYSIYCIPLMFVLPNIFLYRNKKQNKIANSTEILSAVDIKLDEKLKSNEANTNTLYRTKNYKLFIVHIVLCVLGFWAALAGFSNDLKMYFIYNFKNATPILILSALSSIAIMITCVAFIIYLILWKKIIIWNYDEIFLSVKNKNTILRNERANYKTYRKNERKSDRQYYKDYIKYKIEDKKQEHKQRKFQSSKYNKMPASMTKLDKLKELNELLENNIISQDEYDKARADILGK